MITRGIINGKAVESKQTPTCFFCSAKDAEIARLKEENKEVNALLQANYALAAKLERQIKGLKL